MTVGQRLAFFCVFLCVESNGVGLEWATQVRKANEILTKFSSEFPRQQNGKERIRAAVMPQVSQGRLTTESGVALSTSDRASQSTLYFTPFDGNWVSLYTGSVWTLFQFTEVSLSLGTLTSGKNYDVFLYDNAGTETLELSAAWTNDTTRADALALQNGVYVKSGATTRRYLGTIRTTSTTTTEDSASKRFVWNYYHRRSRPLLVQEAANSWTYQTDSWRSQNNSTANRVEVVIGINEVLVALEGQAFAGTAGDGVTLLAGIGLDSTTANSSGSSAGRAAINNAISPIFTRYVGYPGLGYHYFQFLETMLTTDTQVTYYGDNNGTVLQTALMGTVEG